MGFDVSEAQIEFEGEGVWFGGEEEGCRVSGGVRVIVDVEDVSGDA